MERGEATTLLGKREKNIVEENKNESENCVCWQWNCQHTVHCLSEIFGWVGVGRNVLERGGKV